VELRATIQPHVAVGQLVRRHQGLALASSEATCSARKMQTMSVSR
jgi:hypothetical protein